MAIRGMLPDVDYGQAYGKTQRAKSVEAPSELAVGDYLPQLDVILIDMEAAGEAKSKGGIILPGSAVEDPVEGRVVSAGPGNFQNGVFIQNRITPGMWVRIGRWAIQPDRWLELGERKVLVAREEDVLLTIPSRYAEDGFIDAQHNQERAARRIMASQR